MRFLKGKSKIAQEEMVGFVVIIVIVSVVLLILLGFLIKSPNNEAVKSYQVENFIQSALQYTGSCETEIEFLSVQDLMVSCDSSETCLNGKNSCDVLNETLKGIIRNSWKFGEQSAIKGYKLGVIKLLNTGEPGQGIFVLKEGNETRNYKGDFQDFARGSSSYEVSLNVYS